MNRNRNKLLLVFNIIIAILECVFAIYWFGIMEGWWQQNKPTGTFEMLLGSYLIHSLFKNFCIFLAVSAVTNIISIACKFKWGYLISIVCFVFSYNQLPSIFPATEPSILPLWIFILCNIISFFVELFSKNEKNDEEQKIVTSLPSKDYTYSGPTLTLETALSRGFIALEDKEWNKADYFFEYALNLNATTSDAYLGKLLIELNISQLDSLAETDIVFENNNNYKRALQFGSSDFSEKLKDLCVKCKSHNYENYIKSFENATTKYDFEILVNKFEKLNGFELSNKYIDDCKAKIDELEKKFNNILKINLSLILVFIIFSLLYFYYFKPNKQYNIANKLASEKKYNEALSIYDELGDYKDSKEKYHKYFLEKCKELIINRIQQKEYELAIEESKKNNVDLLEFTKDLLYQEGKATFDNKEFYEAIEILKHISTYKDSKNYIQECENNLLYEKATRLYADKNYKEVIALFDNFENKKKLYDLFMNDMVMCPEGSFMMGSPKNELGRNFKGDYNNGKEYYCDETEHKVTISKPFYIGKYEVTESLYLSIMNKKDYIIKARDIPVEIQCFDARSFCNKLNSLLKNSIPQGYRFDLPTEAQWEYACRAGTITSLNSGKNITTVKGYCPNLDEVCWYSENSEGVAHPVGQKKPNSWGIYDMHGNVAEWCKNEYFNVEPECNGWVSSVRGGAYSNTNNISYRSAYRGTTDPDCDFNGFRIALAPVNNNELENSLKDVKVRLFGKNIFDVLYEKKVPLLTTTKSKNSINQLEKPFSIIANGEIMLSIVYYVHESLKNKYKINKKQTLLNFEKSIKENISANNYDSIYVEVAFDDSKNQINNEIEGIITAKSGVFARKEPNIKSQKVGGFAYNTKVSILATNGPKETIENITSNWYKVTDGETTGWCFGGFVNLYDEE